MVSTGPPLYYHFLVHHYLIYLMIPHQLHFLELKCIEENDLYNSPWRTDQDKETYPLPQSFQLFVAVVILRTLLVLVGHG